MATFKSKVVRFGASLMASTVASAIAIASPAPPTLQIDKTIGKVAGWSIGMSESLGGCVAAATYGDGTTLWFGFNSGQGKAYLAFTNARWRSIETGQTYTLHMRASGSNGWRGTFVGFDREGDKGLFQSGLNAKFIADLSESSELTLIKDGRPIAAVSLSGSTEALSAVMSCHKELVSGVSAGAGKSRAPDRNKDDGEGASQGTGFYVSTKGHVLTNNHVVKSCKNVTITRPGAAAIKAEVVANDATSDLALLKTDVSQPVVPAFSPRTRIGESVYVYGFPLNGLLATTGNFTIGNITATAGLVDDTTRLQISAPVQPGNSGGPLVDGYGNVVGVIVSKLNALKMASVTDDMAQNVNFAIKGVIAQNFLESNGVDTTVQARKGELMDGASVAEKAREFTVRVNCQ